MENCNLHTVLDMPGGTFQGAGVKTVVLFFEKGAPTRKIWYYKLDPGRNMGKTNPLNDDDLKEFVALQAKFEDSENSWTVDVEEHRQDDLRSVGEKPQQGGRDGVARSTGRSSPKWRRWMRRARKFSKAFGGCCEEGMGVEEAW